MADSTFTLGTDSSGYSYPEDTAHRALVFKRSDKKLRKEYVDQIMFSKWVGKAGELSPIISNADLTKNPGDQIRMATLPKLDGAGVPGDGPMIGSEEPLEFAWMDVSVNQLRNAVRSHGKASDQRGMFKIIDSARPALSSWQTQHLEDDFFRTCLYNYPPHVHTTTASYGLNLNSHIAKPARHWFCADETNNSITYSATDATYETSIETAEGTLANAASDWMSPDILEGLGVKASVLNIPRIQFKGFSGYLMFMHPYQVAQLRQNADWFNANITAGPRDTKGNPVFAGVGSGGEVGIWNGIYIFQSNKVPASSQAAVYSEVPINGADEDNVRRAIMLGAGAIAFAEADRPHFEIEERDYKNSTGVAVVSNYGMGRTEYTLDTATATKYNQNLIVCSTYSPATTV